MRRFTVPKGVLQLWCARAHTRALVLRQASLAPYRWLYEPSPTLGFLTSCGRDRCPVCDR